MRKEYAHLEESTRSNQNNNKKSGNKKKDPRYTKKGKNSNNDEDGEDWASKNDEALDEMYGYPQNIRAGAGRGSIPHERQRESGYYSSDNRPRHRRDESPRRPSRDHSRDHSRDRYRHRRHSDRSNSRERRRNYEEDRERKASYGNKGRY